MPRPVLIPTSISRAALRQFSLDKRGIHGPSHWGRVAWHGRQLAQLMGENPLVPALFGLLHDSCRGNELDDPEHGERADDFIIELAEQPEWPLDAPTTRLLRLTCRDHSEGFTRGPILMQICWDADRLDLGRVGIRPDPRRLCTPAAKEQARIEQAYAWSRNPAESRMTGAVPAHAETRRLRRSP